MNKVVGSTALILPSSHKFLSNCKCVYSMLRFLPVSSAGQKRDNLESIRAMLERIGSQLGCVPGFPPQN